MTYRAFDSDGHVLETRRALERYGRVQTESPQIAKLLSWETRKAWGLGVNPHIQNGAFDPAERLKDMDREGIEVAVNFPTSLLAASDFGDPQASAEACTTFNNWFADTYRRHDPERFLAPAVVPMQWVEAAVREAERAVKEKGAVGIYVPPYSGQYNLDDPVYDPLYAQAQALGVPILVHGTRLTVEPLLPPRRLKTQVRFHAIAFPFQNMTALGDIICGGVLERFPKLKVAFLESGVGWLPYYMARLDEDYERMPSEEPWLKAKPSEYIRSGRVWFSCDPDEGNIQYVANAIGEEHIVYASDYPHFDSRFPRSADLLRESSLPERLKRKILRGNGRALYNLRPPKSFVRERP